MNRFLSELTNDKIRIKWNKNPIPMELFLSFLTVETRRGKNPNEDFGWTSIYGDNDLVILGGIVNGIEYLNRIEYKKNLDNSYNNIVNPFYLFEILNDEGKQFFIKYYEDEIKNQLISYSNKELTAISNRYALFNFWCNMGISKPRDLIEDNWNGIYYD